MCTGCKDSLYCSSGVCSHTSQSVSQPTGLVKCPVSRCQGQSVPAVEFSGRLCDLEQVTYPL